MFAHTARRAWSRALLLALAIAPLCASLAPALADEVSFIMRNEHPNAIELELYSDSRDHVWPGDNEVYLLDDGETKEISLSCESGESICYGAWISGDQSTYWGVGPGNQVTCTDCCYVCTGGETEEIRLVP